MYATSLAYIVDANTGRSSSAVASNSAFRGTMAFVAVEVAVPLQVRFSFPQSAPSPFSYIPVSRRLPYARYLGLDRRRWVVHDLGRPVRGRSPTHLRYHFAR